MSNDLALQGGFRMASPLSDKSQPRWPSALAAFLLGLFSILWWQRRQDDTLLRQMDADDAPPQPPTNRL
jgi:hypothetical protein